jgi:hypothetical protein
MSFLAGEELPINVDYMVDFDIDTASGDTIAF